MSQRVTRIKNQVSSIQYEERLGVIARHEAIPSTSVQPSGLPRSSLAPNDSVWKKDFPIFDTHPELVYLDSAATSQKPKQVIDAVVNFYMKTNANVHRGIYDLSIDATEVYEASRDKVASFIGAKDSREIVFTGNASEAINVVAYGWARKNLKKGDIIVTSVMEHHSNIVPWLRLKDELGLELVFLPLDEDFRLNYTTLVSLPIDHKRIKLVALSHASNVLGTINPISPIAIWLKEHGIEAKLLVDAAQSVPHFPANVNNLGCDFLVFSGHKMLGPSGIGVLCAKTELLEEMDPFFVGSHMISQVTQEKATWAELPHKFEVGTGKLEAVAGLDAAIDYLNAVGYNSIIEQEKELTEYFLAGISQIQGATLYGPAAVEDRLAVFSFGIKGAHPHDIAEILNRSHIAVRSGHHCAQPLMDTLGVPATARVSLYLYNTKVDINKLFEGLEEVRSTLRL